MKYPNKKPITRFIRYLKNRKKPKGFFFKFLILLIEIHGLTCVSLSYYLAWSDKINVVESVSVSIITEIVAPLVTYAISKTVENIFEKNEFIGKCKPLEAIMNESQEER